MVLIKVVLLFSVITLLYTIEGRVVIENEYTDELYRDPEVLETDLEYYDHVSDGKGYKTIYDMIYPQYEDSEEPNGNYEHNSEETVDLGVYHTYNVEANSEKTKDSDKEIHLLDEEFGSSDKDLPKENDRVYPNKYFYNVVNGGEVEQTGDQKNNENVAVVDDIQLEEETPKKPEVNDLLEVNNETKNQLGRKALVSVDRTKRSYYRMLCPFGHTRIYGRCYNFNQYKF